MERAVCFSTRNRRAEYSARFNNGDAAGYAEIEEKTFSSFSRW